MAEKYDASSIKIIKGLEAVRRRPTMYLGGEPSDPKIQNELIKQALCHAIDEHVDGNCTVINVEINNERIIIEYDASMSLRHSNNPGYAPKCVAELMLTRLFACHNYKKNIRVGDKYCKVGLALVNALSSTFKLETRESGTLGTQTYKNGEPLEKFRYIEDEGPDFTRFEIYPSLNLCKKLVYDKDDINNWKAALSADYPNLTLKINFNH